MDFQPSETQKLLAHAIQRALLDCGDERDARWRALCDLGLPGVEIDETLGGVGGGFDDLAAALPAVGAAPGGEPIVSSLVLASGLLAALGNAAQRGRWLPLLAEGGLTAAVAHMERRARDRLSFVETVGMRTGSGWRLDGAKHVVLGGDTAGLFVLSARTSGEPGDADGLSLFILPRETEGLSIDGYRLYDGSGAADLRLDGCMVDDGAILGEAGQAYGALALAWDRGAAAVCMEAVGAMQALHDLTLDYLKTREQFGQPIGRFQVLQHRMADVHMAVELARSMALLAVDAVGETDPAVRAAKVSAAKVAVGRACREVGQSCVQMHGAIALTEEYAAGRYFRRLTMIERLFGDVDHHLRRYAGLDA